MKTTVELTIADPKKHSVKFSTTDDDAPIANIYVSRQWLRDNADAPNGVRVTIEAI